jgi:hypothetical protein
MSLQSRRTLDNKIDDNSEYLIYDCPLQSYANDPNDLLINNSIYTSNNILIPRNGIGNVSQLVLSPQGNLSTTNDNSTLKATTNPNTYMNNFRLELEFYRLNLIAPSYPNLADSSNSGQMARAGFFSQRENNNWHFGLVWKTSGTYHRDFCLIVNNNALIVNKWWRMVMENRNGYMYNAIIDVSTESVLTDFSSTTSLTLTSDFAELCIGMSTGYSGRFANSYLRNFKIWNYNI